MSAGKKFKLFFPVFLLFLATIPYGKTALTASGTGGAFPMEAPATAYRSLVLPSGKILEVEVADTPLTRKKGLMFRKHLPPEQGMLFIYPEPGPYRIWMKNCLIPLDILWLDEDQTIIEIARDTPPCKRNPCPVYGKNHNTRYVLELNAGAARRFHLRLGDKILF